MQRQVLAAATLMLACARVQKAVAALSANPTNTQAQCEYELIMRQWGMAVRGELAG